MEDWRREFISSPKIGQICREQRGGEYLAARHAAMSWEEWLHHFKSVWNVCPCDGCAKRLREMR